MPWTCASCGLETALDVLACPACAVQKSSWTVAGDQTRQFVVTRSSFTCLRGTSAATTRCEAPPFDELAPTHVAPVVSKARARALALRGERPSSRELLVVRLQCAAEADTTITLEVGYAHAVQEARSFPPSSARPDRLHAAFLLVFGPGSADDLLFPGVEVVDVSEESASGFAPQVDVAALKRPAHELPTEHAPAGPRQLVLTDEESGLPVAHVGLRLRLPSNEVLAVKTDETGAVTLPEGATVIVEELEDAACWEVMSWFRL